VQRQRKKDEDERSMGERRRRSKTAGRICEKHQITLRTIDTKTQIGTKKERRRNDQRNRKWTRKRVTRNVKMKRKM
jgi:hypothetical protein